MAATPGTAASPPPLTHRALLAIAVPIILSNVTTPLIGLVDTAVVGQLGGAHYIGAVALGATIFTFLFWAFGFLRMGTTGLAAQAEGSRTPGETATVLMRALAIAIAAGGALVLLQRPISDAAFALLDGSAPLEAEARAYFAIRIWSAPAALVNYALLGWLIGLGNARAALALQVLLNGLNAVLDAALVLGLGMGVAGVAAGTLVAEIVAALAGLWLASRHIARRGAWPDIAGAFQRAALGRALAVNGDIMIRTLALLFAFTWFMAQSAAAGDVTLAANAVLIQLVSAAAYFLDGFAFSAETLVGQAIGQGSRARFREAVWLSSLWAGVLGLALGAAILGLGAPIVDILAIDPAVRAEARVYLGWAAVFPVVSVLCYQLDGVFSGAMRTADMRNMALASLAIFLAAWWMLAPPFGNHGLWASLVILNAARGLTLLARTPALWRDARQS